MRRARMAALALALAGSTAAGARTEPAARLHYDEVYGVATHNSYWVGRRPELAASGSGERILDQLLADHVRALELDLHVRAGQPGVWSVFHTDRESNSLCSPLSECLKQLQLFQYLVPQHDVVNVVVELKELWGHSFTPDHTIAQLDRSLRQALGDTLYTPRDFLARCAPGATLRACARARGWPTVEALRGKLIVNLLGNWNHNQEDWVAYATAGRGVIDRAAFPMRSMLEGRGVTRILRWFVDDAFDRRRMEAAWEASIFWQLGRRDPPDARRFVEEHGVIRSREAQTASSQAERIGRGYQLIQTDHPGRLAPSDPRRRLSSGSEPAHRIELVSGDDETLAAPLVVVDASPAAIDRWETAPSSSRGRGAARDRARGCLRAATADGVQYFMVCRRVVDGETAQISLHTHHAGDAGETVLRFDSSAPLAGPVGDLISLRVERAGGRSCASAASASQMDGARPAWSRLGSACFSGSLDHQGLAGVGELHFVGTRHNGRLID